MGVPPEEALVSPRDNQPIVIIMGANDNDGASSILAYEKTGAEGTRWVVTMGGEAKKLPNEEFSKATFAKGHKPEAS
jgi:hypothetical protein